MPVIGAGVILAERYQLQRNLGVEGSAVAWEAHDTTQDRRVLVKLLRADLGGDPNALEHFRADIRSAARAGSVSGARVLDAGDDRILNVPFVVFEWLDDGPDELPVAITPPPRPTAAPRVHAGGRGGGAGRVVQYVVLLLVLVPIAVGVFLIRNFLQQPASVPSGVFSLSRSTALATPVASNVPVSRPAAATQVATAPPTAAPATPRPTATPASASGVRRRVANTDGIGVALRATAGGDKLPGKGYDEGVTVTLLEEQGAWARIRGDDGREGWVLAVTLVP
jgi:hypothetical protein